MFDMDSRPTIVKPVVESAGSGKESANSTADSAIIPLKIGLWVWALNLNWCTESADSMGNYSADSYQA